MKNYCANKKRRKKKKKNRKEKAVKYFDFDRSPDELHGLVLAQRI